MRTYIQAMLVAAATATLPLMAEAGMATGTGSMVKKDAYGTENLWGRALVVPRDGTVVRVMYGTYGFSIRDAEGRTIGDFLLPEMAVGTDSLPANIASCPMCVKSIGIITLK